MIIYFYRLTFIIFITGIISCNSPYRYFATDKPTFDNLVGTYTLDSTKADYILDSDQAKRPQIILNADSTFTISNFPVFGFFGKYELCNGKGKWEIMKDPSFESWVIFVHSDSVYNSKTLKAAERIATDYFIYNNKSPYKIYVIAEDPDQWTGVLYKKK